MTVRLKPAKVVFAKWFIRIRWTAIAMLILSTFAVKNLFGISVQYREIYFTAGFLFAFNIMHALLLRRIIKTGGLLVVKRITRAIHLQITLDLIILSIILHFSGGIENPLIIFFFIHIIISSSIFSTLTTYFHTATAVILLAALSWLEYSGILNHNPLTGFVDPGLFQNQLYITGAGIIFVLTAVLIIRLTQMIISRAIKVEEAYVRTNLELEQKDKLQSKYVMRVTHDIKGHISAIMSNLRVVQAKMVGDLNPQQEDMINRAYYRSETLTHFVTELLSLHRKRLRQEPEFEQVSIIEIAQKVTKLGETLAEQKSQNFRYHIDENIPPIHGHPFTLEELFTNLLTNAFKYTPEAGSIEFLVHQSDNKIITEITDTGIGIPEKEIPHILTEFYRASNTEKGAKSGSGLGLSIVKQIVDNHKGHLSISSELGNGTKVTVLLPKLSGSTS